MKRIYLDYASTTPTDPKVVKAMKPYFTDKFGNPSSLHHFGKVANEAVDKSSKVIAKALNAGKEEIVYTSSATESNNLALKGIIYANKDKGNHIIISEIEHNCVINSARSLENQGFEVTRIGVDKYGLVNPSDIKNAITDKTVLVSIMHANNEIGTIEPIEEIGKICKENEIYFHTDAAQSFGKVPLDVEKMNIDLLTASAHKMYGPKGVALLYVKRGTNINPILHGGGQQNNLRSSTINVASIVGFAKAVELCMLEMENEQKRLSKLRDEIINTIQDKISNVTLNGHPSKRLPNNVNISFGSIEGESILMELDLEGIAVSTGSACSSPKLEPSHVLMACEKKYEEAHGSIRISLGRWTTEEDVDRFLGVLPKVIDKLRKISPIKRYDL